MARRRLSIFDAYNDTELDLNPNITYSGLPSGYHVLNIGVLAQKNASSNDYWQTIDGFTITGSPVALFEGTVAGYNSRNLSFSGPWTCGPQIQDLSGGHCYSNTANSTISWTFNGTLIEVYGRPDVEDGYMDVTIDGGPANRVDLRFGDTDDDSLCSALLYAQSLASGTHTISITVVGTHSTGVTGNYVQFDEFVAFAGGRE